MTSLESLAAPSDLLRLNWGERGYSLIVVTDVIDESQRVCVPSWSPSPLASLWHLRVSKRMLWFGLSPPPRPGRLSGVPSQCMRPVFFFCVKNYLRALELFACELGGGLLLTRRPGGRRAALKSHQRGAEIGATREPSGQRCRVAISPLVRLERWAAPVSWARGSWFKAGFQKQGSLTVALSPELRVTERRRKEYHYLLQCQEISISYGSQAASFY